MGNSDLLASVMEEFERTGWTSSLQEFLFANRSRLMNSEDIPRTLIGAVNKHSGEDWPTEAHILESLINEARMQVENEGEFGQLFLNNLATIIDGFVAGKQLSPNGVMALVSCYARANVDAPEILTALRIEQIETEATSIPSDLPDLDKMMNNMAREAGGDFYAMYEQLREVTTGLPEEAKLALIHEICLLSHPASWVMASYWLLTPARSIREQAALALLHRVRAGKLDGNLIRRLPMLRSWMPADTARTVVDEIIREMHRRNLPVSSLGRGAKIKRICLTPPDGVGAQSVAIFTKRKIGLILTKPGYGVKDAYVITCRGSREINGIREQMAEMDARDVSMATVRLLVEMALADGIDNNLPPAHGLLNVGSDFGLEDIRPQKMTFDRWLETLDPEGAIDLLSAQKRGRMINQANELIAGFGIIGSWFEDNDPVRKLMQNTSNPARQEKKLIAYLGSRRAFWAERLFQMAVLLKDSGSDWLGLAVTASALLKGRPIAKIPLMLMIVENTLDVWYEQEDGEMETGIDIDSFMVPDNPGEFLARVGGGGGNPAWLDGYLTAFVIAPKTIVPAQWISPLLEKATALANEQDASDLINLALGRYNEIGMALADQAELPGFSDLSDEHLAAWARGFEQGLAIAAWKGRSVTKSDRNLIRLIGQISTGGEIDFDPRAIIASWANARFAKGT